MINNLINADSHRKLRKKGRDSFKTYSFLIVRIALLMKLLFPKWLLRTLWFLASQCPGYVGVGLRYCLFSSLSNECGESVYIGRNVFVKHWDKVSVGHNVSIHNDCHINALGGVRIGDSVSIAHQTSIISANHSWDDPLLPIKEQPIVPGPILIKSDVWVGCSCQILADVEIGNRVVVAAGAVVVSNVKSNTIVGGVPARKLKDI